MNTDRWADARRVEAWAGEVRVNLLRTIALAVFYGQHLLNVYVWSDDPSLKGAFHAAVTAIVLAWTAGIFVLHVCLSRRWMPPALKYVATFWDHDPDSLRAITRPAVLQLVQDHAGYRVWRSTMAGHAELVGFLTLFFACFKGLALPESQVGRV